MSHELKSCPFCGSPALRDAYDRGISIGCIPCGYTRHFPGLLQKARNDKPILQYRNADGSAEVLTFETAREFYHSDADERAVEEWNKRA